MLNPFEQPRETPMPPPEDVENEEKPRRIEVVQEEGDEGEVEVIRRDKEEAKTEEPEIEVVEEKKERPLPFFSPENIKEMRGMGLTTEQIGKIVRMVEEQLEAAVYVEGLRKRQAVEESLEKRRRRQREEQQGKEEMAA